MSSHLEALEAVRRALPEAHPDAVEAGCRLAQFIATEAAALGLEDVERAASALAEADEHALPDRIQELEEALLTAALKTSGQTLLVVEDDPEDLALLTEVLSAPGRRMLTVGLGREALQTAEVEGPDLIVLDLALPDIDGRLVLMDLRRLEATATAPVVVVTGKVSPTVEAECFSYGADGFLAKPFDPDALGELTNRLLRTPDRRDTPEGGLGGLCGHDEITNHFSRVQRERRAEMSPSPLAVALVWDCAGAPGETDADHSEEGRALGQRLSEVASTLTSIDRSVTVARWGMDGLLVLAPGQERSVLERTLSQANAHLTDKGNLEFTFQTASPTPEATPGDVVGELSRHLLREGHAERGRTSRPTAIVVEDDPVTAELVRHHLGRGGLQVTVFENGRAAFQAIREAPPHLVVLDIQLPGMNGLELLGRIREIPGSGEVKVIVLTSLGDDATVSRAFELGADDYVVKPFSPGEFMARSLRLVR